jgi:hypothetical protein
MNSELRRFESATVTDKMGHAITDLQAEDFEILQDSQPQKITNSPYVA